MSEVRRLVLTAAALVAIGIATGGCGEEEEEAGTGIRGTVLTGAGCGPDDAESCDMPYATSVRIVEAAGGTEVSSASSGADGQFEVTLPPGRYRVEPTTGAGPSRRSSVAATVPAEGYAEITVNVDSEVR